jgi:hypothetical protein
MLHTVNVFRTIPKQNNSGIGFIKEMENSRKSHYQLYTKDILTKERFKLRNKIDRTTRIPFAILGLIWFNLLILSTKHDGYGLPETVSAIWILFQAELLIKSYLSPSAFLYFRRNPLMAASAIIPLLRILTLIKFISTDRVKRNYQPRILNS